MSIERPGKAGMAPQPPSPLPGQVVPIRRRASWEPWLSKQQLAAHLGYSTRWVELRVREGLPSRKMGGRRRFRLSAVEDWLEERFA
jgi:excisionase family DNA binding protein